MPVTPSGSVRLALPLLIAAIFCAGCGANRPAEPFFFPTATVTAAPPATPTSIRTATIVPAATATTTALAAATPTPLSPPCATQPPDARCMSVNATLAARPRPPPLSAYTLTLTAEPLAGFPPGTYRFRARLIGPERPFCISQRWKHGDGNGWAITPSCVEYSPPAATPATPVTIEYLSDYTYRQHGAYTVEFCLTGRSDLCATTTVQVR